MLALAWLLYCSFGLTLASLYPLVGPIREELGLSYAQMGVVFGSWQLVYIVGAPLVGILIDRFGTKRVILIGAAAIAASGFGRSFASSFGMLLGTVSLMGIGGSTMSVALPKLIAEWFTGTRRGLASGIYVTGSHGGMVLSLALTNVALLPLTGSWRGVLQVYAWFALAMTALWALLGREVARPAPGEGERPSTLRSMRKVVRVPGLWPIIVIGFSGFLASHGFRSWLPEILIARGFTPSAAGLVSAMPALSGMIGSIVVVRFAASGHRKRTVVFLLAATGATIVLAGVTSGPVLLVSIFLQGFFAAALVPLMMNTMMEMREIGPAYLGAAAGLYFAVGEMGGFLGPSVVGVLVDLADSFLAGIFLLAGAMWAMLLLTRRLKIDERPHA